MLPEQRRVGQADAIARRQSAMASINPETMRNRVRSGRWQRLQRGVYATFSGDPARETLLWAALLRAGPGAVLSHQTAAERHGLIDEPSSIIIITVPASRSPARTKISSVVNSFGRYLPQTVHDHEPGGGEAGG
jgi:predicted transcriptional regulator of viral defense system